MSTLYIKIKRLDPSEAQSEEIKETYSNLINYATLNCLPLASHENYNSSFTLRFNKENDPKIQVVLNFLAQMGRSCYHRTIPAHAEKRSSTMHVLKFKYSKKELDSYSLYYNNIWYIKDKYSSLHLKSVVNNAFCCYAKDMKISNWNKSFICIHSTGLLAVNDEGKSKLEEAELKGLSFVKINWIDPEYAKRDFYLVRPTVEMPPCKCDLIEDADGCFVFVNGPYTEPILIFDKNEVSHLGEFDMANTVEKIRSDKHHLGGRLPVTIISAKFRKVLEDNQVIINPCPVKLETS